MAFIIVIVLYMILRLELSSHACDMNTVEVGGTVWVPGRRGEALLRPHQGCRLITKDM